MVLTADEEIKLLKLKEEYKEAERNFQMQFLAEDHKVKMVRLKAILEIAKAGGTSLLKEK